MSRYNAGSIRQIYNPFDQYGEGIGPARQQELLEQADADNGGLLSNLFWALDTPGAMVRAGLAGQNPLGALTQSSDERIDGRELLRQYGLVGDEDNWANFGAGLATEVLTDPMAFVSGATKALTPAGKAAAKAGLLHKAPEILSKAYVAGENLHPELAARAESGLAALGRGREAISATDVAGRPIIGRRAASRYGTLQDLVDNADAPDSARQSVLDALGGDEAAYEGLKGQVLGRDLGIGLPFKDPAFAVSVPGGTALSDTLDAAGQLYRWSPLGRAVNAFSNNAVGQAFDAESQMLYQGADAARQSAMADARKETAYQAAKLYQREPDVFSEEGNRALGRLIEQPKDSAFKQADSIWDSDHPAARAYREWWSQKAEELPQEFSEAGLRGATFDDPFISGYLPRKADGMLQQAGYNDNSLGRVLRTLTSDQMRRSPELQIPGGRDMLAFELSRDPVVAGSKRAAKTDQEAADYIASRLYGDPTAEPKQALYLAQLLNKLPDDIIKDVPLFGQHPVASIAQYVEGRAGAKATVEAMYDSLAGIAAARPANLVEGGGHISLAEALNRIGSRTTQTDIGEQGAKVQMRTRLAQRLGINPDKVNLAEISVPEDHVNRLIRVRESYTSPEAARQITGVFDAYTRLWKNSILAWVSRINRDLYSGAYSNWLEGAFDIESAAAAKAMLSKSAFDPDVLAVLKKMPKYAGVADDDIAARFYADMAAGGIIDGSYMADRRMAVSGGQIQNMLVGVNPETFSGALSQLGKGWGEHARAFLDARGVTAKLNSISDTSPILKAGAAAGNISDKINRLTGYISLLKQGVSPEEAARRMKRAHVDYSSLTPMERYIRDKIFPFYAYTSRIFGEVLRQMAERPGGRYGQGLRVYERAQEGNDEYVPEYMRRQFAAAIDPNDPVFGWLGIPQSEGTRFFTGIDLPGYAPLQMFSGDGSSIANNMFMQMNPALRTGAEILKGEDFFTQSPINAVSRSYGPIGKGLRAATGDPNAGSGYGVAVADKLLDLVPFASRPARMAAQIYDTDSGVDLPSKALAAGINFSGAGRLRDVSTDAARQDAIKKLQQMARPYTRDITIPTIPKGMEAMVPQTAQDSLALSRQMQREVRDIRRRRKEQYYNPFED